MYFSAQLLFIPGLLQSFKARRLVTDDREVRLLQRYRDTVWMVYFWRRPMVSCFFFDEDPFWILLSPKWRFPNFISPKRFLSKPFDDLQDELQPLFYRAPEVGNWEKHQWMELHNSLQNWKPYMRGKDQELHSLLHHVFWSRIRIGFLIGHDGMLMMVEFDAGPSSATRNSCEQIASKQPLIPTHWYLSENHKRKETLVGCFISTLRIHWIHVGLLYMGVGSDLFQ